LIEPTVGEDRPELNDSTLRQFAALWTVLFLGLAAYHGLLRDRHSVGVVVAATALLVGPVGLVRPRSVRFVFAGAMALAKPIGWVVSHAVLAAIFYLVITPLALVFRLSGRDALARRSGRGAPTHWAPRRQRTDPWQYLNQS
jgi:hypothetical protein